MVVIFAIENVLILRLESFLTLPQSLELLVIIGASNFGFFRLSDASFLGAAKRLAIPAG